MKSGDQLLITIRSIEEHSTTGIGPTRISCSIPDVLNKVKIGQKVLIDDGKIGARLKAINDD